MLVKKTQKRIFTSSTVSHIGDNSVNVVYLLVGCGLPSFPPVQTVAYYIPLLPYFRVGHTLSAYPVLPQCLDSIAPTSYG